MCEDILCSHLWSKNPQLIEFIVYLPGINNKQIIYYIISSSGSLFSSCLFLIISSLHFRYKVWFLFCNELLQCSLLCQPLVMIGFLHILRFPLHHLFLFLLCSPLLVGRDFHPWFCSHFTSIIIPVQKCSGFWISLSVSELYARKIVDYGVT